MGALDIAVPVARSLLEHPGARRRRRVRSSMQAGVVYVALRSDLLRNRARCRIVWLRGDRRGRGGDRQGSVLPLPRPVHRQPCLWADCAQVKPTTTTYTERITMANNMNAGTMGDDAQRLGDQASQFAQDAADTLETTRDNLMGEFRNLIAEGESLLRATSNLSGEA